MSTGGRLSPAIVSLLGLIASLVCTNAGSDTWRGYEQIPLASQVEVVISFPKVLDAKLSSNQDVMTYLKAHATNMNIVLHDDQDAVTRKHPTLTLKSGPFLSKHQTAVSFAPTRKPKNGSVRITSLLTLKQLRWFVETLQKAIILTPLSSSDNSTEQQPSLYKPSLLLYVSLPLSRSALSHLQRLAEAAVLFPGLQLMLVTNNSLSAEPSSVPNSAAHSSKFVSKWTICAFSRCLPYNYELTGSRKSQKTILQSQMRNALRRTINCGELLSGVHQLKNYQDSQEHTLVDSDLLGSDYEYGVSQDLGETTWQRKIFLGPSGTITYAWIPETQANDAINLVSSFKKYSNELGCLVVCSSSETEYLNRLFAQKCNQVQAIFESQRSNPNGETNPAGVAITSLYLNGEPAPRNYKLLLSRERLILSLKENVIDAQHGILPRHYTGSTVSPVYIDDTQGLREFVASSLPSIVFVLRLPGRIRAGGRKKYPKIEIYRVLARAAKNIDRVRIGICILGELDPIQIEEAQIHVTKSFESFEGFDKVIAELDTVAFETNPTISKYSRKIMQKGVKHLTKVELLNQLAIYSEAQDWLADL